MTPVLFLYPSPYLFSFYLKSNHFIFLYFVLYFSPLYFHPISPCFCVTFSVLSLYEVCIMVFWSNIVQSYADPGPHANIQFCDFTTIPLPRPIHKMWLHSWAWILHCILDKKVKFRKCPLYVPVSSVCPSVFQRL